MAAGPVEERMPRVPRAACSRKRMERELGESLAKRRRSTWPARGPERMARATELLVVPKSMPMEASSLVMGALLPVSGGTPYFVAQSLHNAGLRLGLAVRLPGA